MRKHKKVGHRPSQTNKKVARQAHANSKFFARTGTNKEGSPGEEAGESSATEAAEVAAGQD